MCLCALRSTINLNCGLCYKHIVIYSLSWSCIGDTNNVFHAPCFQCISSNKKTISKETETSHMYKQAITCHLCLSLVFTPPFCWLRYLITRFFNVCLRLRHNACMSSSVQAVDSYESWSRLQCTKIHLNNQQCPWNMNIPFWPWKLGVTTYNVSRESCRRLCYFLLLL